MGKTDEAKNWSYMPNFVHQSRVSSTKYWPGTLMFYKSVMYSIQITIIFINYGD